MAFVGNVVQSTPDEPALIRSTEKFWLAIGANRAESATPDSLVFDRF
jgi:hypothetical protein